MQHRIKVTLVSRSDCEPCKRDKAILNDLRQSEVGTRAEFRVMEVDRTTDFDERDRLGFINRFPTWIVERGDARLVLFGSQHPSAVIEAVDSMEK